MSVNEGAYIINPDTILEALAQGNKDVFTPIVTTPDPELPALINTVQWSQADYFHIAEAFHEFFWKESSKNWNLHLMIFSMDCKEINQGPQYAYFQFFVTKDVRENQSRYVHDIYIEPTKNLVSWHEVEYYPNLANWQSIDIANLKISALNAFRIAETRGGNEIRSEFKNNCIITATLAPGSIYDGWQIGYVGRVGEDVEHLLDINIDASTGEYKIVNSIKK